ncbi:hypothetical protein BKA80DRAFT_131086 [Phyllosticta citrichinensis]
MPDSTKLSFFVFAALSTSALLSNSFASISLSARGLIESNSREVALTPSHPPSLASACPRPRSRQQSPAAVPFSRCCAERAGMSIPPQTNPTASHKERKQARGDIRALLQPTNERQTKPNQTRPNQSRSKPREISHLRSVHQISPHLPAAESDRRERWRGAQRRPFSKHRAQGCETRRSQLHAVYGERGATRSRSIPVTATRANRGRAGMCPPSISFLLRSGPIGHRKAENGRPRPRPPRGGQGQETTPPPEPSSCLDPAGWLAGWLACLCIYSTRTPTALSAKLIWGERTACGPHVLQGL